MRSLRSIARQLRKKPAIGGLVGPMEDVFDTPALRVLRALVREGPMNQRRFVEVTRHAPRHAQALREKLETLGFLVVRDKPMGRRITASMEIDLTPEGRKMGELSIAQEEVDERAKRKRTPK